MLLFSPWNTVCIKNYALKFCLLWVLDTFSHKHNHKCLNRIRISEAYKRRTQEHIRSIYFIGHMKYKMIVRMLRRILQLFSAKIRAYWCRAVSLSIKIQLEFEENISNTTIDSANYNSQGILNVQPRSIFTIVIVLNGH